MSRRRPLIVLFGLLAFAGLVIGATVSPYSGRWLRGFSGIPGIEDRIEDDAVAMLDGLGITDARVSANGRDLTIDTAQQLPGSVQNDLAGIDGVGTVSFGPVDASGDDDRGGSDVAEGNENDDGADDSGEPVTVDGEAPERSLQLDFDGETISMSGAVATAEGRDAMLRSAERLVGEANVVDEIEVTDSSVDDFTEVSTVASIVRRLGEWFDSAELDLEGDQLLIAGVPADGADIERADQVVSQLAQRAGLEATVEAREGEADDDGDTGDGADTDGTDAPDSGEAELVTEVLAGLNLGAIDFEPGTAILTESAVVTLDDVAGLLIELPPVPLAVVGHTSTEGDPDVNLLLSDDRARAVREYLIGKGVAATQLDAFGVGGSQPIADNSTEEGRASNERIDLVVAEGNN